MAQSCIFCHSAEGHICAVCTQVLLSLTPVQAKEGYKIAVDRGYPEKAEALGQLLFKEENGGRQRRVGKLSSGKRSIGVLGGIKVGPRFDEVGKKATIYKGVSHKPVISEK